MAVIGVITNEGLSQTINAANKEGWNIYPTKFAISTNKGSLSPSRDTDSVGTLWFEAPVTSRRVISDNSIEFICNIPPNATNEDKEIGEIYLFGESSDDTPQEFLLALGQPSQALTYYFDGSISLRLIVTLTNINISDLFVFQYEDSVDIDEHNMDPDAHPKLIKAVAQWVKGLGNALLRNGQLLSGGSIYTSKDPQGGDITVSAEAAAIYVNGAVLYVPEKKNFQAPGSSVISWGVWVDNSGAEVGGGEDLTSPEASVKWGMSTDPDVDREKSTFYEVYKISDGKVLEEEALLSDEAQEIIGQIMRYDVDANGNYAVNGLNVRLDSFNWDDTQDNTVYSVSSGRAHVGGREINVLHDHRMPVENTAVTYTTNAEPVAFIPDSENKMDVVLDFGPVEEVIEVIAPVKVTGLKLERRSTSGSLLGDVNENPLGVSSVQAITRVYSGDGREFLKGDDWDYKQIGNSVVESVLVWLSDSLPQGSQFYVDFIYNTEVTDAITLTGDRKGFSIPETITPADSPNNMQVKVAKIDELQGDQLYMDVDYRWRIPRIDRLYLDAEGRLTHARGAARPFSQPKAPSLPDKSLSLAEMYHTWWEGPDVKLDGVQVVKMSDLNKMQQSIYDLYDLVALERLKNDTARGAPTATHGLFVDPMLDDDMRDLGAEADFLKENDDVKVSATINPAREELVLPIQMSPNSLNQSKESSPWTLEYEHTVLTDQGNPVEQTKMTGSMKVNPYAAFKPIPAKMTLIPAVDIWTETKMNLKSGGSINSTVVNHGVFGFRFRGNVSSAKIGETTRTLEFLRALDIEFTIEGFIPNTTIQELKFDNVPITPQPIDGQTEVKADQNGVVKGIIPIPGDTFTAGRKLVEVTDSTGQITAQASFTGKGTVTTEEWQTKFTGGFQRWDPLAQTFTLNQDHYVAGVDIKMTTIGTDQIVVQLRTTSVGIPDKTIAEVRLNPEDLLLYETEKHNLQDPMVDGKPESYKNPNKFGWTRIEFDPTFVEAGTEYAFVVLTDDPDHEMAIAELGGVSEDGEVISAQAYQIGVMLSSSNATTWTPHQSADLTFRLLSADFVNTEREIDLATLDLDNEGFSDAMVVGGALRPSNDSDVVITFTDQDNISYDMTENAPLRLTEKIKGTISVKAKLKGNKRISPIVWPELLMMIGKQQDKAIYCTRTFAAGSDNSTLSVKFEAELPGSATVQVYYRTKVSGKDEWVEMINPEKTQLDTNVHDWEYKETQLSDESTRILLKLSGDALNRPVVRNLRAMAY
ncbi:DUF4815 domain-containing protein [Pseudoalteromonas umbrosa]|uniref:DUF4815 domain-containing protein n=1 Tax=Pseudoalteromonas umbrosa TaxID=3048489 RepID=UPI0024C3B518|nr:DUF4815 domain-containing protein [Pseudoalteromonas sp. B95]MDK1290229.1 DUF4815 domain-containing protein [Pseudoalteromonas sp. B95]